MSLNNIQEILLSDILGNANIDGIVVYSFQVL